MIKPNMIIKHNNAMDVCFLVHRVRGPYLPNENIEVTGDWINMAFVKSFTIGERTKFKITPDQLPNWQVCLTPSAECLRYATWTKEKIK